MSIVWKSNLKRKMKERLFLSTVESVLLYGSETWTINKTMHKRLDGWYTKMLRMTLNISWKEKLTTINNNQQQQQHVVQEETTFPGRNNIFAFTDQRHFEYP